MGNKIKCQVIFEDKEILDTVLNLLKRTGLNNEYDHYGIFDFNWVIPEPTCREECEEKFWNDIYMDETGSLWFSRLAWRDEYWCCTSNADDVYISDNMLCFTCSDTPFSIFEELSRRYRLTFKVNYASDNYGHCGCIIYKNGKSFDVDLQNEFSRLLWGDRYYKD